MICGRDSTLGLKVLRPIGSGCLFSIEMFFVLSTTLLAATAGGAFYTVVLFVSAALTFFFSTSTSVKQNFIF